MTTNDAPDTSEGKADKDPAWYREQIETSKKTITDQQAKLERMAFKNVGLDPETGMGRAIKMTFEGSPDPENLEPLIEHAKSEFDLELKAGGTEAAPTTAKPEVSAAEGRMAALDGASTPVEPDALQEEADAKLKEGDVTGSITAMLEKQIREGNLNIGGPKQS